MELLEKFPKSRIIYLSSDKFTNLFIQAIRNNSISDFSNFFNALDVLIIDDIQYLAGKSGTQETFSIYSTNFIKIRSNSS